MSALKFVNSVWQSFRATSGLEPRLLDGLRVTAARPGVVNFELDIQKEHTNRLNILHGGTIASMVDLGGSLAVASRGLFSTGVSTDLNVGKTLAYTSIKFMNDKDEVFARGSHTKYIALAFKDPKNIVEELKASKESS
uniref:Putative esterase C31F10.02 n=1 Tax=Talaromyces marneffei PM1 TaxID=1077442 RepID=A0A093XH38_TALMA